MPGIQLTRRHLLRGGLALAVTGLAAAAVYGYRVRYLFAHSSNVVREELHDKLRRTICAWLPRAQAITIYFHYLDIPAEIVQRFLADYDRAAGLETLTPLQLDVYGRFLMSTDFFPNGADESKPIAYVAFYDPLLSPCYNPLQMGR